MTKMEHGDFSLLADNYAKYRPGYSTLVRDLVVGLLPVKAKAADVGAGTGIWSKMLADGGLSVTAVEPNEAMRKEGLALHPELRWVDGSAEVTTLPDDAYDLASMASSFHWPDFDKAVKEFKRILKPGAYFLALWNTRDIAGFAVLEEIEAKIKELVPTLKRVSSGSSEFCDTLTKRLESTDYFKEVAYIEGFHIERQTPERYLGLWKSVNDVRVQAGEEKFKAFLDFVVEKTKDSEFVSAKYKTRAWLAQLRS
ncbi:MAG: class I SAM-dependent methyltransferase [Deltaproteobacteria bacterium]|nr:class I SAM-dependent methyltransferase [Deltaproteobacteria bacterium]